MADPDRYKQLDNPRTRTGNKKRWITLRNVGWMCCLLLYVVLTSILVAPFRFLIKNQEDQLSRHLLSSASGLFEESHRNGSLKAIDDTERHETYHKQEVSNDRTSVLLSIPNNRTSLPLQRWNRTTESDAEHSAHPIKNRKTRDAKRRPETDRTKSTGTTKQRLTTNGANFVSEIYQNFTVPIGGSITLNCSTVYPMEWTHQEVEQPTPNDIYQDGRGLIGAYGKTGRHSVEHGTKNLLITNITKDDAGIYRCTIQRTWNDIAVVNLAVTVSNIECSMNPNWNDIVGENDCGIRPDNITFRCSIAYHGSFVPTLICLHSGQQDIIENIVETRIAPGYFTSVLSVPASLALNGTHYTCRVKEAHPGDTQLTWTSPPLNIQYFFNKSMTIEASEDDEIRCSANSSQSCEYQWINEQQRYVTIIKDSNFKPREDVTRPGIYHCRAECRIRDKTCVAIPLRTKYIRTGLLGKHENVLHSEVRWDPIVVGIISAISSCIVVVVVVGIIVWCKCLRRYRYISSPPSYSTTQDSTNTVEDEPMKVIPLMPLEN